MLVEAQARWLPKAGNAEEEYEDAFWPALAYRRARSFHCAIADGATETSFSGQWARLLVEAYGIGAWGRRHWHDRLDELRCAWKRSVGGRPLPWYAEEKVRQGAYAAFLGVSFSPRSGRSAYWSAVSVGDCCLFQVRDDELVSCFPIESADQFNSRPYLIGSVRHADSPRVAAKRRSGGAEPGDTFLLMSDAVAAWFLSQAEGGARPWAELDAARASDFACWVHRRRTSGDMRNDDVTVLSVTIAT